MDIHRCRFLPYQPSSINALAFSHSSNPKQTTPKDLKLALGRGNGDVEIWNPIRGLWTQERIFRGGVGRTIEQLLWTQDINVQENEDQKLKFQQGSLRLFSSGGSPNITEWDIEKGLVKRHADGNKGDIWCMAAQPQWTHAQQMQLPEEVKESPAQRVAAGCSDGSIILFSTADDDLQFDRVLVLPLLKKSKVISITWRGRDTVVAGYEENVIRVIDVRSRRVLRNITLGKSRDGEAALVWAVKCLPNGTILSGDSTGELKIWDSQNYSLVQRLKTHTADVLDITTNTAGTIILTCGVDRRTVAYALRSDTSSSRAQRWHEIRHRRFHEHDVKTITSYESKDISLAVSGGMDTVPIVVPLLNWNDEYHRSLPYLPHKPQMSVSPANRLMLSWWGPNIFIWNLPAKRFESADLESAADDQMNHKLLAQIQLKEDEYLTSAEIATSGDMVTAATNTGVKLFRIRKTLSRDGDVEVRFRPLQLPSTVANQGASKVGFAPDSKWLYAVRLNNVITLVRISPTSSTKERPTVLDYVVKLDRKRRKSTAPTGLLLGNYARNITTVAFSSDTHILAVGDMSGSVDTWILTGSESSIPQSNHKSKEAEGMESESDSDTDDESNSINLLGQQWIRTPGGHQLPQLDSAVLVLSFKPTSSTTAPTNASVSTTDEGSSPCHGNLVAITSSHEVIEFNVQECKISDWSRRNPSSLLPASFRLIKDRVKGAWWHCTENHERFWMYGESFVYMIDLSQDMDPYKNDGVQKKRRIGMLGNHVVEVPEGHALQSLDASQKGEAKDATRKRKRKSGGAGDEMRQHQKYGAELQRIEDDVDQAGLLSPPESIVDFADTDEDYYMSDNDNNSRLEDDNLVTARRRRKQKQNNQSNAGEQETSFTPNQDSLLEAVDNGGVVLQEEKEKEVSKPASWHTFQYRGIFGACLLQKLEERGGGTENGVRSLGPEVVIVERPMYDVELLPRFTSGQEW